MVRCSLRQTCGDDALHCSSACRVALQEREELGMQLEVYRSRSEAFEMVRLSSGPVKCPRVHQSPHLEGSVGLLSLVLPCIRCASYTRHRPSLRPAVLRLSLAMC